MPKPPPPTPPPPAQAHGITPVVLLRPNEVEGRIGGKLGLGPIGLRCSGIYFARMGHMYTTRCSARMAHYLYSATGRSVAPKAPNHSLGMYQLGPCRDRRAR
jgi:hypothetical protein